MNFCRGYNVVLAKVKFSPLMSTLLILTHLKLLFYSTISTSILFSFLIYFLFIFVFEFFRSNNKII